MIAATTLGEYKEHFLEDEALARRFRCVHVAEPTIEETRRILLSLRPRLERNYGVRILDEALDMALEMSPRYMRHQHLPDKVIGWMDTAAVRTEIGRRWHVRKEDVVSVISHAAQIPEDMVFRDVTSRFKDIEAQLQRRVVGERAAISTVAHRLVLNKGPLKDGFDRPDGVLLFLGPTGVGKTELAKVEKANPSVLNLFLQAFDEGWLTDGRGRRVYLSDAIVIMTSNVGSEHFRKLRNPFGFLPREPVLEQVQADIRRDMERRFSPEFLNRIDEVVLFSPLTHEEARTIATQYLSTVASALAKAGKTIEIDDDAMAMMLTEGYSPAYGARFLKRVLDERVKLPISVHWHDAPHFHVRGDGGEVIVEPASLRLAPGVHAVA